MEFQVLDANGQPISMVGKTLLLSSYLPYTDEPYFNVTGDRFEVDGLDLNVLRTTLTAGETNVALSLRYSLWNLTDNKNLFLGYLNIVESSKNGN